MRWVAWWYWPPESYNRCLIFIATSRNLTLPVLYGLCLLGVGGSQIPACPLFLPFRASSCCSNLLSPKLPAHKEDHLPLHSWARWCISCPKQIKFKEQAKKNNSLQTQHKKIQARHLSQVSLRQSWTGKEIAAETK